MVEASFRQRFAFTGLLGPPASAKHWNCSFTTIVWVQSMRTFTTEDIRGILQRGARLALADTQGTNGVILLMSWKGKGDRKKNKTMFSIYRSFLQKIHLRDSFTQRHMILQWFIAQIGNIFNITQTEEEEIMLMLDYKWVPRFQILHLRVGIRLSQTPVITIQKLFEGRREVACPTNWQGTSRHVQQTHSCFTGTFLLIVPANSVVSDHKDLL